MTRPIRRINRSKARITTENTLYDASLTLDDLFDIFINAKLTQGLSPRTIQDHRGNYRYFTVWLNQAHPNIVPAEIDVEIIREWIRYMQDDQVGYAGHPNKPRDFVGLSPVTINVRLRNIKCFFKFLADERYLDDDPTARIKILKTDDEGVHTFTQEQVKSLLAQPDRRTFAGFRDYVLMLLMLDTGLRINEALNVQVQDIDLRSLTVTVRAKTAKTRTMRQVPISRKTGRELNALMAEVKAQFGGMELIFTSTMGDQLQVGSFRSRLRLYAEQSGITGPRVSPHTFRHTFAKLFITNGGDPFTLQHILGHSDLSMTKRYVQLFNSDIRRLHRRATPLDGF